MVVNVWNIYDTNTAHRFGKYGETAIYITMEGFGQLVAWVKLGISDNENDKDDVLTLLNTDKYTPSREFANIFTDEEIRQATEYNDDVNCMMEDAKYEPYHSEYNKLSEKVQLLVDILSTSHSRYINAALTKEYIENFRDAIEYNERYANKYFKKDKDGIEYCLKRLEEMKANREVDNTKQVTPWLQIGFATESNKLFIDKNCFYYISTKHINPELGILDLDGFGQIITWEELGIRNANTTKKNILDFARKDLYTPSGRYKGVFTDYDITLAIILAKDSDRVTELNEFIKYSEMFKDSGMKIKKYKAEFNNISKETEETVNLLVDMISMYPAIKWYDNEIIKLYIENFKDACECNLIKEDRLGCYDKDKVKSYICKLDHMKLESTSTGEDITREK